MKPSRAIVCQYANRILFRDTGYDFKTALRTVAEAFDEEHAIFQTQEHAEAVFAEMLGECAYDSEVLDPALWYSNRVAELAR